MLDSPDCHKGDSKERMRTSHQKRIPVGSIRILNIYPGTKERQKKQRLTCRPNVTLKFGQKRTERLPFLGNPLFGQARIRDQYLEARFGEGIRQ